MRGINERFIEDLSNGSLSFFLHQVKAIPDLCLEIRGGYINIYYRGGNLLRITQVQNGYRFYFDNKYFLRDEPLNLQNADDYRNNFFLLMDVMNNWFAAFPKLEREFQHNLLKSNTTILDIEYQTGNKSRFDMLLFYDSKLIVAENKYGGGAIAGKAGVAKHYQDICDIIENEAIKEEMKQSVVNISANKHRLGLIDFEITREDIKEIEILFLFADFNPRSKAISNEVKLMNKSLDAKILFMGKDEYQIRYNEAKDLFAHED